MVGIRLALAGFIVGLFFTFSTPPQINIPNQNNDDVVNERVSDNETDNEGIAGGFRPMNIIKKDAAKK